MGGLFYWANAISFLPKETDLSVDCNVIVGGDNDEDPRIRFSKLKPLK